MTIRVPRRALSGGEIDPDLWYASDLDPVRYGAASVRNMIVRDRGGVERAPGTEFLVRAKTAAPVRLGRFIRSGGEAYLCEYGPSYVRVYEAGMAPGDAPIADLATPYVAADLPYLQWAQSNDVQWIFSGRKLKELRRSGSPGAYSFALVDAPITAGPFRDENTGPITLTASAVTGAITLTASAALFAALMVGSSWRIAEEDMTQEPSWLPGTAYALADRVRYNGRIYRCDAAGTSSTYPPEHEEGTIDDGSGVQWTYLHSGFGVVSITGYTSATQVSAQVISRLPESVVAPGSYKWREGAWSDHRGHPVTGALYSRSLWAGGTAAEPYRIWKSALDGLDDFAQDVKDDSPLDRDLIDGQTEAVLWMAPGRALTIGTEGPEWIARPIETGDVVRPKTLLTEIATNEGAAPVPGLTISGATVFVDVSRRRLKSISYDYRSDAWRPRDLSLLAPHLFGLGVAELAYQRVPYPVLWCLLDGGTEIAALTYLPDQNVLAWHRHDLGAVVQSIAVLPVEGGRRETLFAAVKRDASPAQIERMFDRFRPELGQTISAARYLHCASVFSFGVPTSVITGLDHLNGKEVIALVDGNSHPPVTVTAGQVTLNFPGLNVVVGLPYLSAYETMPFDAGTPDDDQASRRKRVSDLALAFRATQGGTVKIAGKAQNVKPLGATPLDAPPALFDGIVRIPPPAADDKGQIAYENDTAWPATLTAIFPEYEV